MGCYEVMKKEQARLAARERSLQNAIAAAPEGCLELHKNGESYRTYVRIDGKRNYISKKEQQLIHELAKKKYYQKMLLDTSAELNAVNKYLRAHSEQERAQELLLKNPRLAQILDPLFVPLDKKLADWAKEEYPSTADHPENLIHPGPLRKMFRSKSESSIAQVLYTKRLAYRYEWDKEINDKTYHIDFTIRHPKTGAFIYWEHLGLIDKPGYSSTIGSKLHDYESVGIFPDRNLILTYESKKYPFEYWMAEEIVEKWFFSE